MEKIEVKYVYDKVESREHILSAMQTVVEQVPLPSLITVSIVEYTDQTIYEADVELGELSCIEGDLEREAELGVDNGQANS